MKLSKKFFHMSFYPLSLISLGVILSICINFIGQKKAYERSEVFQKRQFKLYEISSNLGYVGGIHAFKNYVLRSSTEYRDEAIKKLTLTLQHINEYRKITPQSKEEIRAMNELELVVSKYLDNVYVIDTLFSNNIDTSTIDTNVKISDLEAKKSLDALIVYYQKQYKVQKQQVKEINQISLALLIVILTLSILLSTWFHFKNSKNLMISIEHIKSIFGQFNKGNYKNIDLSELKDLDNDEIKDLTQQLLFLGANIDAILSELQRSNEDLSNFAFIASHDLQAPLKKISSYIDLIELKSQKDLTPQTTKFLEEIKNSSINLINLTDAILDYASISKNEIELDKCSLAEIIEYSKSILEKDIIETKSQINYDHLPQVVSANKELMVSVFQNLISNSLKYRKPDSAASIDITSSLVKPKEWRITYKDNGIGFNMKDIETILKPFGRVENGYSSKGMGIGMALCKRIIESHGSVFYVSSHPNNGIEVSFHLKEPAILNT